MVKTLKDLCEREPELAHSIRERFMLIAHELIGENVIRSETLERIHKITGGEKTVAEYITDMLYNAPIIINGYSSFEDFLESVVSGKSNGNGRSHENSNRNGQHEHYQPVQESSRELESALA